MEGFMKNISKYELPLILEDFLNYLQTIKGKSVNTTKAYFYDLRVFFRFLKLHKKLVDVEINFDEIEILDVNIDLLKTVKLSDLYAFMSYMSNNRNNSSYGRSRKSACLKSFFNTSEGTFVQSSQTLFKPCLRISISSAFVTISLVDFEPRESYFKTKSSFASLVSLSIAPAPRRASVNKNLLPDSFTAVGS